MPSLHIGTLPKISFKNLTPGLYTSSYGNYKIRSIKHYTQINIETQPLELLCTKRCSCRNTCVGVSMEISIELQASSLKACNFKRLQQLFSCQTIIIPANICWSWRRLEDVLKTSLEDLLKILWRQTKYLLGISVYLSRDLTNLNVYLTSLYFTNLYLTTLKRIQNALITGDCLVLWN